ncbi:cysteine hydrolase [Candidatus Woesearchaeota archaeon]|nr:cysteine hydrolase [Candidatus Woesearchaeota archaeon]
MKALLLVDFEKEWINPDSEYYVGDISEVLAKTNKLIDFCRKQGYKLIFTTHVEEDSEDAFAEGTESIEIIPELHKEPSDILITKNKVSPFYDTDLDDELEDIEEIVIAGILTNLCVRSAIHDAYDRDFDITVIKDCCVAFDEATQEFTFDDLAATREEIKFLDLDEFEKEAAPKNKVFGGSQN